MKNVQVVHRDGWRRDICIDAGTFSLKGDTGDGVIFDIQVQRTQFSHDGFKDEHRDELKPDAFQRHMLIEEVRD